MLKQIIKLITSSFAGQIINLAVLLTVVRLVLPAHFGIYQLALTVTTYIIVIASAKYHHAIFILDDVDAKDLAVGSRPFCLFISIVSTFCLCIANNRLGIWDDLNFIRLTLVGVAGYFSSTNLFFYYLALKKNEIKKIMYSRVIAPLFGGIVMLLMAWIYNTPEALLVGYVFTLYLANYFISPNGKFTFNTTNFFLILKKNLEFPTLLLPAGVLETLNASYLLMAATYFFGVESAAFIGMYYRLVASPQGMICTAISDVYRKKIAYLSENKLESEVLPFFIKSISYLLMLAFCAATVLYVFSEYGIEIVLGEQWSNCRQVFVSLIPMFAVTFVISPLTSTLYVRNGQKYDLLVQIIFISMLTVFHYSMRNVTLNDFVLGYSFIVIAKQMLELFFCYKCINNSHTETIG